jgi:serine/threonine protein kinase
MWNNPEKQTIGQPWEIDAAKLHINQKIGSGAFGAVFEGRYERTKQPVAIKRMALVPDAETQEQQVKEIHNEMTILWGLRHPHLLDFFGVASMNSLPIGVYFTLF